jgi:hypothetical protein
MLGTFEHSVIEAEQLAIGNAEQEASSNGQGGELSDSYSQQTLILNIMSKLSWKCNSL